MDALYSYSFLEQMHKEIRSLLLQQSHQMELKLRVRALFRAVDNKEF